MNQEMEEFRTEVRKKVLRSIEDFEQKLSSLPDLPEEDREEEKEQHRINLFDSVSSLCWTSHPAQTGDTVSFYEEGFYSLLSTRLRRMEGFYLAMVRFSEDARNLSASVIGDVRALSYDPEDLMKLVSGMDEVDFARRLGSILGLYDADTDEIVKLICQREFAKTQDRTK